MKKNIAMRVAAFLFILTMISTCAFATTFAKYTTHGEANDTARVAKFGVKVEGVSGAANTMFSETEGEGTNLSVKAVENVVAPGTSGKFSEFTITGTPEVAVNVYYDSQFALSTGWALQGGKFYCPILVTINGTTISGLDYASAALFTAAVDAEIERNNHTYAAGTDLTGKTADTNLNIIWQWGFFGSTGAA